MIIKKPLKIAMYTAIIGDYEEPRPLGYKDPNIDYVLFTDQNIQSSDDWEVRRIQTSGFTNRKTARCIKALSHSYLKDYDITIWIDGNFSPKVDLKPLINSMHGDILLMCHPMRNCIYDEARKVNEWKMDDSDVVNQQMYYYKLQGYPEINGLCATGILIRKHTTKIMMLNEFWWHEILGKSARDQLSFDYSAWATETPIQKFPFEDRHEYFTEHPHKGNRPKF